MSNPQDIGKSNRYHWWYDSKAAGVRNPPGIGMGSTPPSSSPPQSPTGSDITTRRFSLTSGFTTSSASPPADVASRPRRDSLKNMFHLSDFGTPGT